MASIRRRGESGFSMVELLIVIVIIGILAAIAIPTYLNQRDKAKDAAVMDGVYNIEIGVASYAIANEDVFPPVTEVTRAGGVGRTMESWPMNPWTDEDMADTTSEARGDFHYISGADSFSLVGYGRSGIIVSVR